MREVEIKITVEVPEEVTNDMLEDVINQEVFCCNMEPSPFEKGGINIYGVIDHMQASEDDGTASIVVNNA